MKLKNKKTGEIIDKWPDDFVVNSGSQIYNYGSLAELCEEWEDCEEPKKFWFVDQGGAIFSDTDTITQDYANTLKAIGNYFESKEEAELAAEKLKALKRLRDKGFKFTSWKFTPGFDRPDRIAIAAEGKVVFDVFKDMNVLFVEDEEC